MMDYISLKKITVENGSGEATFDALYDNNGNRQKSIETGEYKAVLANLLVQIKIQT